MTDPVIQIRNLSATYKDRIAIHDVTVDIPSQQITAIIGPSGCGKTTLLRSMSRLIELNEGAKVQGEVLFHGQNIYAPDVDATEIRKQIGLLAQRPCPLPMSIYENVAYGPRIHGTHDRKTLDALVEKELREAELWDEVKDRLHNPASALSIGQQQRLCLARGLAVGPEVLLCDEATSALDPLSARHIEDRLMDLKNDYTIIMVTHVLRQARRLADYVIFMYMGKLIEHGPAKHVLVNPQEAKTKAYLEGEFY
ncbi:MAG: phosphate ABC transporter ATP-binding protein [Anaerolineae bacterium]|nr:phosphate ABC transporter ATP-binding protein [Anaerolineae bacterium]